MGNKSKLALRGKKWASKTEQAAKAKSKGSTTVKVKATAQIRETKGGAEGLFSSKPTPKFRKDLESAVTDNIRAGLDINVQGYVLSREAILSDITDVYSPFKWPNSSGTGKIFTENELKAASKDISNTLYKFVKGEVIKRGAIRTSGKPNTIIKTVRKAALNSSNGIGYAYDDSGRAVYYWNSKKRGKKLVNSFEAFTKILRTSIDSYVTTLSPGNNTRIYWEPDPDWMARKAIISEELRQAGATERQRSARWKIEREGYRSETGKSDYQGIHFGHTFGAAATAAAAFLDDPSDLSHTFDENDKYSLKIREGFSPGTEEKVRDAVFTVLKEDTRVEFEKEYSSQGAHGQLTIFISENAVSNAISGGKTTGGKRILSNIVRQIKYAIVNWGASPSFGEMIEEIIISSFYGQKVSNKKYSTSINIENKANASIKSVGPKGFKGKPVYNKPKGKDTDTSNSDLTKLISFLNKKLHDKIRENMGKGKSKQTLNYRTGRFARSAKIQTFYPVNEKGAIGAQVRYMRNPYKVFEPKGSHLATPGRNPARIFGRSIRQLLQEEKIANLRRVKVTLRG